MTSLSRANAPAATAHLVSSIVLTIAAWQLGTAAVSLALPIQRAQLAAAYTRF